MFLSKQGHVGSQTAATKSHGCRLTYNGGKVVAIIADAVLQVFALTSCTYQVLMNKFAKLPSVTPSVAELPDSQLLTVTGKLLADQFVSCVV